MRSWGGTFDGARSPDGTGEHRFVRRATITWSRTAWRASRLRAELRLGESDSTQGTVIVSVDEAPYARVTLTREWKTLELATRSTYLFSPTTVSFDGVSGAPAVGIEIRRLRADPDLRSLSSLLEVLVLGALLPLIVLVASRAGSLTDTARRRLPQATVSTRSVHRAALVAALVPFVYLVALLSRYAVDVPFWDEWIVGSLVDAWLSGALSVGDLWTRSTAHLSVVPITMLVALARLTSWSIPAELALNLTVAIGSLVVLVAGLPVEWRASGQWRRAWLVPAFVLLVLSARQWENWLWGWQLQIFVCVLAVVVSLDGLSHRTGIGSLIVSAGAAIVASCSFAAGLLSWPLGFVLIILSRARHKTARGLLWVALAVTMFVAYQATGGANPGVTPAVPSLVLTLQYLALYLGGAIVDPSIGLATVLVVGACGLGLYALCAWHGIRNRRDAARRHWLVVGLFPIGAGLMTAAGRHDLGLRFATSSRYTTIAMLFWVALVASLALVIDRQAQPSVRAIGVRRLTTLGIVGILLLAAWTSFRGRESFRTWHGRMSPARAALVRGDDPELLRRLLPDLDVLLEQRRILQRRHLSVFRDD
jgi:hypothetical protein